MHDDSFSAHTPEAIRIHGQADVCEARLVAVADPGGAIVCAARPGTASQHALLALRRSVRIVRGTGPVILGAIEIMAPLPHIARHVIQPPGIRLSLTDDVGLGI